MVNIALIFHLIYLSITSTFLILTNNFLLFSVVIPILSLIFIDVFAIKKITNEKFSLFLFIVSSILFYVAVNFIIFYLAFIPSILAQLYSPIFLFLVLCVFFALLTFIKIKNKKIKIFSVMSLLFLFCLIATHDIIMTNILGAYYRHNLPKSFLKEEFNKPISLYIQNDTLLFGQSKIDNLSKNYLFLNQIKNDMKINKIGLTSDYDGLIYVYYMDNNLFEDTPSNSQIKTQSFTKDKMPDFDYTIKKEKIKLNDFVSHFINIEKTELINNKTSQSVGLNISIQRRDYYLKQVKYGFTPLYAKATHDIFEVPNLRIITH